MVNLEDWDFPIPDPIILVWLSLLEALVWGGAILFGIAIFYEGGFISLPYSPSSIVVMAAIGALFVVLTLLKFRQNDIYL